MSKAAQTIYAYFEKTTSEMDSKLIDFPNQPVLDENGKHVLIEKPMTSSVIESEILINLAKQKGLTIMVDHTFLYLAETEKMKDLIQSGEIGDVYKAMRALEPLDILHPH